jgi:hypothetical protein
MLIDASFRDGFEINLGRKMSSKSSLIKTRRVDVSTINDHKTNQINWLSYDLILKF